VVEPTTALLPTLGGGGVLPPVASPPSSSTPATSSQTDAVDAELTSVYGTFLHDISGLDDNLNQSWVNALEQVATAKLVHAAQLQADNIASSQEHATGTLRDAHQVIEITSSISASIFDCLDEENWYLVENSNGKPDPGITRGYYVGIADLLSVNGRWYVDVWQPAQGSCRF
jgi:hypothetical protein